jgi:hypothetical protein
VPPPTQPAAQAVVTVPPAPASPQPTEQQDIPRAGPPVNISGGTAYVDGDTLALIPGPRGSGIQFGAHLWADFDVQFQVMINGNRGFWIQPRIQGFMFNELVVDGFEDMIGFTSHRNGESYRLAPPRHFRLDPDHWYLVRLQVRGPDVQFFLDGQLIMSARDDELLHGRVGIGTRNGAVRFRDIRVTRLNGSTMWNGLSELSRIPPEQLAPRESAIGPLYHKTDLLAGADPSAGTLSGSWSLAEGRLTGQGHGAQIAFGYCPAGEYDYRVTFTRAAGDKPIALIVAQNGRQFAFVAGNHGNTTGGFSMVNGMPDDDNTSTQFLKSWISNGTPTTVVIRLQKGIASAYLNGQLEDEVETGVTDMSLPSDYHRPATPSLGIWLGGDPVTIESADVLEYAVPFQAPVTAPTTAPTTNP